VWAADFQCDATAGNRLLRILNVSMSIREALAATWAARSTLIHRRVVDTIAADRGYPQFIHCHNGPERTPLPGSLRGHLMKPKLHKTWTNSRHPPKCITVRGPQSA